MRCILLCCIYSDALKYCLQEAESGTCLNTRQIAVELGSDAWCLLDKKFSYR